MRAEDSRRPDSVYRMDDNLYVNLTSRCVLRCRFCFKSDPGDDFFGYKLLMTADSEPAVDDIVRLLRAAGACREIVFCGLGEPLQRFDDVVEIATRVRMPVDGLAHRATPKSCPVPSIRVNTSGCIDPEPDDARLIVLSRCVDAVSISLNAHDAATYAALCRPPDGTDGFERMLRFARRVRPLFEDARLTVVAMPGVDLESCRSLAGQLGYPLAIRPYVPPGDLS